MRKPNRECVICFTPIYRRPYQKGKVFCSQTCYGIFCRKPIKCCICTKEFLSSKKSKTCSRACSNKLRLGTKYKSGRPTKSKVKSSMASYVRLSERDGEKCSKCGLGTTWEGKPLRLQIDHIDGNRDNNEDINKRLLCPNCHSQTDTFGARNIKKKGK